MATAETKLTLPAEQLLPPRDDQPPPLAEAFGLATTWVDEKLDDIKKAYWTRPSVLFDEYEIIVTTSDCRGAGTGLSTWINDAGRRSYYCRLTMLVAVHIDERLSRRRDRPVNVD